MVARGEIWWAEAPSTSRRPFLILSRQATIDVLHSVIVMPATRTIRNIPTEVELDETDGMPTNCVLTADNVTSMPKVFFTERITRLRGYRLAAVCDALSIATACREPR